MASANNDDNKLEFFDAMRDFRKMFPTIEDDVIEAVLRANNGAVDDTIDQLLVMSLEKEEDAFAETLPKRIGDLATASPRVDLNPSVQATAGRLPNTAEHSAGPASPSSASASPSTWLVELEENSVKPTDSVVAAAQAQSPSNRAFLSSPRPKKKIYRPPLVGALPPDFLRLSSSADPWEKTSSAIQRTLNRPSYSARRSTVDYDGRHQQDVNDYNDGPPPPYAVAVGRRHSDRKPAKIDKHYYRSPHHTYLGVFRTTTVHRPPSPRRAPDRLAPSPDALRDAMDENEWKRRVARDPELAQYLEDERIAIMLQNEEFMRHLRNDREFLAVLEQDAAEASRQKSRRKTSAGRQQGERDRMSSHSSNQSDAGVSNIGAYDDGPTDLVSADPFPYTKTLPKSDEVERSFQEKLTLMGRESKRKFATMARRFINKSRGAKGVLDDKESRTHALLLDSDDEGERTHATGDDSGYNQPSDAEYNIGRRTDLKQGRFF